MTSRELLAGSAGLQPVRVSRISPASVEIRWNEKATGDPFAIFRGDSPDTIVMDKPLAQVTRTCSVVLSGLATDRPHFFKIAGRNGAGVIAGERRLPVEGAPNLRDMGGYETENGQRVKWGQVFRSGTLGRLTAGGIALLKRLGIRLVCDFRTEAEARKFPGRFPDSPEVGYLHLAIQHGDFEPTSVFERIRSGDYGWISEEFMLRGYIDSIELMASVWAMFFNGLSDPENRPLLFHCTGGKDRTGVAAALVLLALGVPEETVIADYGLSDGYNADVRKGIYDHLQPLGVDIGVVEPYFTAPSSRLCALLKYIRDHYGSAEEYLLKKAGVPGAVTRRLKQDLLE
jgi:protein-tyrosine phosphatase